MTVKQTGNNGDDRDRRGRFRRGNKAARGRPKGSPNRVTGDLKAAFLTAFDAAGGVGYLIRFARSQPARFLPLLARLLPTSTDLDATVHAEFSHTACHNELITLLRQRPDLRERLFERYPHLRERYEGVFDNAESGRAADDLVR